MRLSFLKMAWWVKSMAIPEKSPRKIVVVGTSGCGKTTLGRELAKVLDLKSVDLDDLCWLPNWQSRDDDDFFSEIKNSLSNDHWVVSGNYSRTHHLFWPQADMIVWLDLPLLVCLWNVLKRSLSRVFTRTPCCNGNYETIPRLFRRDSILLWAWGSYPRRKKAYAEFFSNNRSACRLVRLTSYQAVKEFVESFPNQAKALPTFGK